MDDNSLSDKVGQAAEKTGEAVEKAKETAMEVKNLASAGAKAAAGDYLGAFKDAMKSKMFRKRLKIWLIQQILMISIPVILVGCLFSALMGIVDDMVDLIGSAISTTTGFFAKLWQQITDDYWIDLDDSEKTYIIDNKTGLTIGYVDESGNQVVLKRDQLKDLVSTKYPDGSKNVNSLTNDELVALSAEYLADKDTVTKDYSIVDAYIKDLGDQGVSVKALRMIGTVPNGTPEEELLEIPENKELLEKYISEFLRADIITQQIHKRHDEDKITVNPSNQNEIDGGIYLYRTTGKTAKQLKPSQFSGGSYENMQETTGSSYKRMDYVLYEDFMDMIADNDEDARYSFTLDTDNNLVVAEITTTLNSTSDVDADSGWFEDLEDAPLVSDGGDVTLTAKVIPYKEYIAKYAMPYEFLVNLCQVTQNPEFVYHIAMLARDTDIAMVLQDNVTVDRTVAEVYQEDAYFKNDSDNQTSGATGTLHEKGKTRTITTSTTETPTIKIEYADAWSFYDEYQYIEHTSGTLTEDGPNDTTPALPETLPVHHDAVMDTHKVDAKDAAGNVIRDAAGNVVQVDEEYVKEPEYWDNENHESEFITKREQKSQVITVTTTYEELNCNSVEKSKQFLGMLRNDTGECDYDCFKDASKTEIPQALECARNAVFNEDGINVQYRIPGLTKTEAALNKLTSGEDMLYSTLQKNSTGYKSADKILSDESLYEEYYSEDGIYNNDPNSAYVVKMQGLVEHMRYLMSFPENEEYVKKWNTTDDTNNGLVEGTEYVDPGYYNDDPGTPIGKETLTEDDLEILYRITEAEATGLSKDAKGHVASVVLNRVMSSQFPNTIKEVVFQKKQFSPIADGRYYKVTITDATREAVDYVLANGDTSGAAIFFKANYLAKVHAVGEYEPKWGTCTLIDEGHTFYTTETALNELRGKKYTPPGGGGRRRRRHRWN